MSPRIRAAAVSAALLLALAGCGSDGSGSTAADPAGESSSTSSTPTPSEGAATPTSTGTAGPGTDEPVVLPACGEVWVAGAKLPRGYEGCVDGSDTVPADGRYCEFGKQLLTFGDAFYAVAGGPVQATGGPLLKSARYRDALEKCGG
jgi:hypothetical protein